MQLFEVENQINMQYLTQLLQNEQFEIQKYKYRSNLWNADNLHSQELLSLFRQFQFYDSAKKQAAALNNIQNNSGAAISQNDSFVSIAYPQNNHRSQINQSLHENGQQNQQNWQQSNNNQQEQNGDYVELQVVEVGEEQEDIQMVRNNSGNNLNGESQAQKDQMSILVGDYQPLLVARRQSDDPYTVKVILSDTDEIHLPATMQKYPFKHKVYDLTYYSDVVTKGILRRLIFLSISGYIGFDNTERLELIKGAFLLEFDAFFEYLMKPNIDQILQFDQNQDEVLEALTFMWQVNIRKSMKYYDFIVKIATINSSLYKRNGVVSPKILNLDLITIETQFLPLIHRILQGDVNITSNQTEMIMKQIIEFYEIHNSKHIVYPFLQQKSEKDVSDTIEEKFQNLLKEFECPVCFLPFDNCYTSKCGHSFCQNCIVQSVQKFGNCPVCQQITTQEDLFRNFHMNEIKNIAYQEKEVSKTYEINRMKHMDTFKEKFQEIMQTNIINSLSIQIEKKQQNNKNEYIQSYESVQKLKKQIQYLVNVTFDQLMNSLNIES